MLKLPDSRCIAAYIRTAVYNEERARDQTALCSEYSLRTFGTQPKLVFCDLGASGISCHREQLENLIQNIRTRRVHSLVTSNPDRLHRSISHSARFFGLLREHDVTLHCVSSGGPMDLDFSSEGNLTSTTGESCNGPGVFCSTLFNL